ncbi:MAG: glycogen synthase [Calditrichaeota bacterium]|nr:glycogen synthase [Calditrichota bacterium]RQV98817.1 MAG: glycogen synthase [Calditrichota bacterium]
MEIVILTREYPPHTYGGAGVHVEYLTRELAALGRNEDQIKVLCFGDQHINEGNLTVTGISSEFQPPFQEPRHRGFMNTLLNNVVMVGTIQRADIIHCHTWYSHLAGVLAKQISEAPLVLSTHSLEPHRPWKEEQLGTAYRGSSWIEKTAYENSDGVIAVSQAMKKDVQDLYHVASDKIRVIHNGIDLREYQFTHDDTLIRSFDIDPEKPFVLFVGRITRQKGIIHLVNAIRYLNSGIQVVLCAGAPDTEEISYEMEQAVEKAKKESDIPIVWIPRVLPKNEVITLYSHAALFVCPSVYEPFGIINLEAMACETPVVASAVGGIPEIVVPEETGLLVPFEAVNQNNFEPKNPEKFSRDLAEAVNRVLSNEEKLHFMGRKSRERVEKYFSWQSVARRTREFYEDLRKN